MTTHKLEKDEALNDANKYDRLQSLSCTGLLIHPSTPSLTAEYKGISSICGSILPKSKSRPEHSLKFSSSQTFSNNQHGLATDKNTQQGPELFKYQEFLTNPKQNVDQGFCNYGLFYLSSRDINVAQAYEKSDRPLSEILQQNQEADEKTASGLACKELRCPKTCTNWKAHCLHRSREISVPPFETNKFLNTCAVFPPSSRQLPPVLSHYFHENWSVSKPKECSLKDTLTVPNKLDLCLEKRDGSCLEAETTRAVNFSSQSHTPAQIVYCPVQFTNGNHFKSGQNIDRQVELTSNRPHEALLASDSCKKYCSFQQTQEFNNIHKPSLKPPVLSTSLSWGSPCVSTLTQFSQSNQPELKKHSENFCSSLRGAMAKGYVRAWAEQINQHGPPSGSSLQDESELGGSVQSLVKKLSQPNVETEWQSLASNGKEYSSNAAQKRVALPGNQDLSRYASESKIKNDLYQNLMKAADKKKGTLDLTKPSETVTGFCSPSYSQGNGQRKISPSSAKKNIQPEILKTLSKLNIECSPPSNVKPSEELKNSPSYRPRKYSEPPPWSPSVESQRQHCGSNQPVPPPASNSKLSPKSKPPVDYSRKPSINKTNLKRPSLPSQDLIPNTTQSEFQQQLSVVKRSASDNSSLSSPPSSPSSFSPQETSHDLVYKNFKSVNDEKSESKNVIAIDNDVFIPQSTSDASSPPQISVSHVTEDVPEPCAESSGSENPTLNPEPCLRLRPSPGRSSTFSAYRESVLKTIYDNSPPIDAADLFDSSWSDSDSFSNEFGNENDEDEVEEKAGDTTMVGSQEEDADGETPVPSPVVKTKEEVSKTQRHALV